jgi:hypothetical protein
MSAIYLGEGSQGVRGVDSGMGLGKRKEGKGKGGRKGR